MKRVEFWKERDEREREKVERRGGGKRVLSESVDGGARTRKADSLKEKKRNQRKKEETEREIEREIKRGIEREKEVVQDRELALSMGSIEEESVDFGSSGGWDWGIDQELDYEEEMTWSGGEIQDGEEGEKRAEWLLSNAQFYYSLADNRHKNYDNYFTDTKEDEDGATRRGKARRTGSLFRGSGDRAQEDQVKNLLDAFQVLHPFLFFSFSLFLFFSFSLFLFFSFSLFLFFSFSLFLFSSFPLFLFSSFPLILMSHVLSGIDDVFDSNPTTKIKACC